MAFAPSILGKAVADDLAGFKWNFYTHYLASYNVNKYLKKRIYTRG
jgi:hypothetical protein